MTRNLSDLLNIRKGIGKILIHWPQSTFIHFVYSTATEPLSVLENWKPTSHEPAKKSKSLSSEQSNTLPGTPSPANEGIAKHLLQKNAKRVAGGQTW